MTMIRPLPCSAHCAKSLLSSIKPLEDERWQIISQLQSEPDKKREERLEIAAQKDLYELRKKNFAQPFLRKIQLEPKSFWFPS